MKYSNIVKHICTMLTVVVVAGCKEVLYSDLSEIEANEMVAVLAASDIASSRMRDKDGIYALSVDEVYVAEAVVLLRAEGYPKEKFQSLGDIFNSDGIIGTPFEQNARFIHAMNEELSHALSSISGVRSAKVLTTAPVAGRYERSAPAATASVTVHYEEGFDATGNIGNFKRLVASAVPNLEYENVTVTVFKAGGIISTMPAATETVLPVSDVKVEPVKMSLLPDGSWDIQQAGRVMSILSFLAAALLAVKFLYRHDRNRRAD